MSKHDLAGQDEELLFKKRAWLFQQLKARREQAQPAAPAIPRQSREVDSFPLSFAQQRLWFIDQLQPGSVAYALGGAIRLTGSLDRAALQRSLDALVQRHETLRTTFTTVDGRPAQVIAAPYALVMPLIDLQLVHLDAREDAASRLTELASGRPFDLARGPLIRALLMRLETEVHVLVLTMHHIISDGWSVGVLIRELGMGYTAHVGGQPAPLPPLAIQYVDYAVWQRSWLQGPILEAQLAYWREQLTNLPGLQLPTDHLRPPVLSPAGASHYFALPQLLSDALLALSRQADVTLFMTLTAAFKLLLHHYSGQEDLVIGTPIANRQREEIEPLIGFFVNTLVLRSDLSGNPTFRTMLGRVREVCLNAYTHQDIPFEYLVEVLQPARDLSHHPLFQVLFALQNTPTSPMEMPNITMRLLPMPETTAKFDLHLSLAETAQGLAGSLEYSTDLFDAATIARLIGHFQVLLAGLVAEPDRPAAELPLLTTAEWEQIAAWNATQAGYAHDRCIHELFEAQAARTRDAVALTGDDQQLTYGALDRRANQLAHHLASLGVGPEVCVGLYMRRLADVLVAILGVLKAGGAYVPLDPAYPPERIAFMLKDSYASILITHQSIYDLRFTIWRNQTQQS